MAKRFRAASERLNAGLDRLNERFADVEAALKEVDFNVRGFVRIREDEQYGTYDDLAYARTSSGWRLVVESGSNPENEVTTPLANATKELRVLAASKLEALVAQLLENAEAEAVKVEAVAENVGAVAARLLQE